MARCAIGPRRRRLGRAGARSVTINPISRRFAATLPPVSSVQPTLSRFAGFLLCLGATLVLPDCGARTELLEAEACPQAGQTRACRDACGAGVETCAAGYWGNCEVPSVASPCAGVCGAGTRTCANGVLGSCEVPITTRSCSNDCGTGEQRCEQDVWQSCVVPLTQRDCSSVCGSGHETCTAGIWGACDAPLPKPPVLHTTIRDFHRTQTDFELPVRGNVNDRGMVQSTLGADGTPVYAGKPVTITTPSGQAGFDVWYHDTPGVNVTIPYDLQLTADPAQPGSFFYEDRSFFPIEEQGFGKEGLFHNFHFTLETHTEFVYRGGEIFTFAGDDDVWVFIANQLVIDLGGLHTIQTSSVFLDRMASQLGLVVGQKYPLDLFFAERHTFDSDFVVHTTIADVGSCE